MISEGKKINLVMMRTNTSPRHLIVLSVEGLYDIVRQSIYKKKLNHISLNHNKVLIRICLFKIKRNIGACLILNKITSNWNGF